MKKILSIFLALLMLTACHQSDEPAATTRRTILVYMEARNSLKYDAVDDLNEMLRAAVPADCRLLVYYSSYDSAPELMEIANGVKRTLKTYAGSPSAVDPAHMSAVLSDARSLAPARERGLVMWSHSSGWMQSLTKTLKGFGLEDNARQISVTDLATALHGQDFDFLVFDSCYMACVEVAYELRHCACYLAASECEVPTGGMDYSVAIPALFRKDMVAGLKEAIDLTVEGYLADATELCPSTMSLIDLSKIDALAESVKATGLPIPEGYEPQLLSRDTPYRNLFFDLGHYLEAIGAPLSTLQAAVVHSRHTDAIWGSIPLESVSGLSIYLPGLTPAYTETAYGYNTLTWYNMINRD